MQKTVYELRGRHWSAGVCTSGLLAHVGLSGLAVGSATAFCQHVRDTRGGDLPGTGLVPFRSALLALDDFDWVIGEIHVSRRSGLMGWRASRLALRQPWRFLRRSRQPQMPARRRG